MISTRGHRLDSSASHSVLARSRSDSLPTGVRRTFDKHGRLKGFQTYVWVQDPAHPRGGYQAAKRWPPTTPLAELKAWRSEKKLRVERPDLFADPDQTALTFAQEARHDYLQREKVKAMPTFDQRQQHIEEWITIFGRRERKSIQPHEIDKALDAFAGKLSAASVNKRRTALMDLWTVLDGRHQANPVKATKERPEPEPEPRAPALGTVLKVLRAMPTHTDYARKCRARLKVIAWTGWPHAIIKQLEPADREHWQRGEAFVKRRKKGKGARARWLPLLPEAQRALAEFHKTQAYGWFSNSSLHKRVTAACKAAKVPIVRPYDLRHGFLTLVAVLTRDERAVMEMGLISTPKIARRYTEAATDPRVQAAVKQIAAELPGLKRAAGRRGRISPVRTRSKSSEHVQETARLLGKSVN